MRNSSNTELKMFRYSSRTENIYFEKFQICLEIIQHILIDMKLNSIRFQDVWDNYIFQFYFHESNIENVDKFMSLLKYSRISKTVPNKNCKAKNIYFSILEVISYTEKNSIHY